MKTAFFAALLSVFLSIVALGTHLVYCFTHHAWVLLLVGAIAAPIGVLHGIGLWFGFWI